MKCYEEHNPRNRSHHDNLNLSRFLLIDQGTEESRLAKVAGRAYIRRSCFALKVNDKYAIVVVGALEH